MISANTEDICTVISVLPLRLNESKPLVPSTYVIEAVKDVNKDVSTLVIRRGQFTVYIDESRPALTIPETSDIIAGSICRDFKVASSHFEPSIAEPGLFFVRGGYDNIEVLASKEIRPDLMHARELQQNWFKRLVAAGDDDWSRYHMRRMISDLQRVACKCLGLSRPWDIDIEVLTSARTNCKYCRAEIHPEAIICMHCRGILDMERYKSDFKAADVH